MKLFRSIIASFTALALLVSTAGVRPVVAGQDPNGQILELNEEYVQGWAYDADYKGLPSEVHIYIDGSLYKNTIADIPLQSLVDLGLTPSADHSFIVRFQDYTLVSGNTYEIRAYALDNSTRAKVELSGSPMSLTITGGGNDNSTPKAKINVKSSRFETGDPLAFDATSSTTTDHQTFNPGPPPNLTFQWTLVPPVGATVTLSSTTLPTVFFTPAVPGDYTVSLTVTDPVNSATHEATQTVTVVSPGVTAIQPSIISFVDIADAEPDTFYTSNTNVLSGFIHPVSVTAVGGRGTSIVKNGYNTGSTSVMVATGDIVALRSQSSSLPGSEETVTFTIGPTTVTWTIYTAQNPVHAPCTLGTQSWDVPGEHMFTDTSHCEYLLFEVWGAGKNGRYESQSIQKSTNNEYILHVGDLQGVLDTRVTQNDPLTGKAVTVLKAEGRLVGCPIGDSADSNPDDGGNDPPPVPLVTYARISVSTDVTTPVERQVQAGTVDLCVARFVFTATGSGVTLRKLRLCQTESGNDAAVSGVQLRIAENSASTIATVSGGYAAWNDLSIAVPFATSVTIDVLANISDSNVVADVAGRKVRFVIRNLEDDWTDGATPSDTNGVANGSGETGDLLAIDSGNGCVLVNSSTASDDHVVGDQPAGVNAQDSVGCGANDGQVTYTQHIANSLLTLTLSSNTPTGYRGWASGADRDIFRFEIAASDNTNAANPKEVFIDRITVTVEGDAEADQFELYGPSDPVNPMATSTAVHRTTVSGGSPAYYADHASVTTTVLFVLTGYDRFIPYGTSKSYRVRARVYALTDATNLPQRSFVVSIASYGDAQNGGDILWSDNGDAVVYPFSHSWNWVYDPLGICSLVPTPVQEFDGDTYIP